MANGGDAPFEYQVALGLVPGWTAFRKFGMNPAINGSNVLEDMWPVGGQRVLPTSAGVATVVSDSAEDDLDEATPPGTGVYTIVVEGLDANFLEVSETVTMQGTTPVNTTQTFRRINRAYCVDDGTGLSNAGNITISVGGNTQAYIEANEGQTHLAMGTVPADKVFVINYYNVGIGRMAGSTDCQIFGQIRLYDESSQDDYDAWRTISDIWLWNGQEHTGTAITVLPPRTDYRIVANSSAATQGHGIVSGFLVTTTEYNR